MKEKDLISIIVPVYNTELYLAPALDSILAQTYENIEVILIDDGSTDGSRKIMEDYCGKDKRIQPVYQKNAGVAEARNEGIRRASGKYIAFWDSDDIIPEDALEALYKSMTESGSDLACGGVTENDVLRSVEPKGAKYLAEKEIVDKYDRNFMYTLSVCNKLFRRDIISDNGLLFNEMRFLEDGDFLMRYIACIDRISGCDQVVYNIRIRPYWDQPSATQLGTETMLEECRHAVHSIGETIRGMQKADRQKLVEAGGSAEELAEVDEKAAALLDTLYYRFASINVINSFYRLIWKNSLDYTDQINKILEELLSTITDEKKKFLTANNPDIDFRKPLPDKKAMDRHPLLTVIVRASVGEKDINKVLGGLYAQRLPSFNIYVSSKLRPYIDEVYSSRQNLHFFNKHEMIGIPAIVRRTPAEYITVIDRPVMWEGDGFRMMVDAMTGNKDNALYCAKALFEDDTQGNRGLNNKAFRTKAVRANLGLISRRPVDAFRKVAEQDRLNGPARVYIGDLEKLK